MAGVSERLSVATVGGVTAGSVPTYDRGGAPRIVHLGVGAFARAHLGVYADDLLGQGWPAMIGGVSLRSARAEQQLAPQDGLYSVTEREPDGPQPCRVIGALSSVATGWEAAVAAIAAPTTELVTLTVTEKGYDVDPHDVDRFDLGAHVFDGRGVHRRDVDRRDVDRVGLDGFGIDRGDLSARVFDRGDLARLDVDRVGVDRVDTDRLDPERLGPERLGPERLGPERLGPERIDPADHGGPPSAPAVVALGLLGRYRSGAGRSAPVVASLDNLVDNGRVLRERVIEVAERVEPAFARWVGEAVRFPCSVVDRMVPATTPADLDDVEHRLGVRDEAAVVAEHHRSWIIEAADGLPPLADVGAREVGDIGPFQRRKLWLLNGPHSALAYAGLLAGCDTIAEAAADRLVSAFVGRLVDDVLQVADLAPSAEPRGFAGEARRRFANPALGHTCRQVGADGSQKLAQRTLPVVAARQRRRLPTGRFAVVVAVWVAAVTGMALDGGRVLPAVDDPEAARLSRLAAAGDLDALAGAAVGPHADRSFAAEVAGTLARVRRDGVDVLRDAP